MNNNNSHGGFLQGFLIGMLLGGGAVFLLGTKKGKKLLKTITEEGLERISELEDLVEDEVEEFEESVVPQKPKASSESVKTENHINGEAKDNQSTVHKITTTTRRFFKGIPKKN